jgi:hypothetical protein
VSFVARAVTATTVVKEFVAPFVLVSSAPFPSLAGSLRTADPLKIAAPAPAPAAAPAPAPGPGPAPGPAPRRSLRLGSSQRRIGVRVAPGNRSAEGARGRFSDSFLRVVYG